MKLLLSIFMVLVLMGCTQSFTRYLTMEDGSRIRQDYEQRWDLNSALGEPQWMRETHDHYYRYDEANSKWIPILLEHCNRTPSPNVIDCVQHK